jgi:hypothetical protein
VTNSDTDCWVTGNQWQTAVKIFQSMPDMGLSADVITCSSVISALAKGKQYKLAVEVGILLHPLLCHYAKGA